MIAYAAIVDHRLGATIPPTAPASGVRRGRVEFELQTMTHGGALL